MNGQEFSELLKGTQRHISAVYSGAVNGNKKEQLRAYIEQYLRQQYITGELTHKIPDQKFSAVCRGIAGAVL